ncbi:MAG: hypothetical protein HY708_06690 [Ignavibacteriae bacterium]|nr:hypothetical protein [Ignavibacteriota bacterium]
MRTIHCCAAIAVFLLLLSTMTTIANGAFEITLSAEKTDFRLGEPVVLLVSLTNKGQEPVNVSPELGPEADNLQYLITNPDGKETPFSPLFVEDRADFITLGTNETARGTARVFYGGNGYSFPKPGKYSVVATFRGSKSQSLEIRVLPPANDAEREQASLILDHSEVGLFLMLEGGDELVDAKKQIDALTTKHPNSTLTHYVRYAVAKNLSVPARNFVTKKPRSADISAAVEILQGLKDKEFQYYYQDKAVRTLATSLDKLGRKDDARRTLQDFQKKLEKMEKLQPFYMKKIEDEMDRMK